jgi:hypothetical protein
VARHLAAAVPLAAQHHHVVTLLVVLEHCAHQSIGPCVCSMHAVRNNGDIMYVHV